MNWGTWLVIVCHRCHFSVFSFSQFHNTVTPEAMESEEQMFQVHWSQKYPEWMSPCTFRWALFSSAKSHFSFVLSHQGTFQLKCPAPCGCHGQTVCVDYEVAFINAWKPHCDGTWKSHMVVGAMVRLLIIMSKLHHHHSDGQLRNLPLIFGLCYLACF